MNQDIKVGKFTLESLTTGMYNDPKIVYREYIQNSVDSLEEALNNGNIFKEDMKIEIIVDNENDFISIKDNGTGIKADRSFGILTSIGDSNKRHTNNRGFRGIGRLGGLSYCNKLKFITSYKGENSKTTIEFDCKKLREILIPGQYDNYDLSKVINEVVTRIEEEENNNEHYFKVIMEGIDTFCDLLNLDVIESYIKQVAPLPYEPKFIWKSKIMDKFKQNNKSISEFPIYIGRSKEELEQVYKPNKDKFYSHIKKKLKDELHDIELFEIKDEDEMLAIGWYGKCNLYGGIIDKKLQGLRVRKGNILIGDSKVIASIFREDRFNSWIQGEVFILSDKLIPNARRDNFEQNITYHRFIDILKNTIGEKISEEIRTASKNRNKPFQKKIKEAKKVLNEVEAINKDGFNSTVEKEHAKERVEKFVENISKLKVNDINEKKIKDEIINELTDVVEKTEENDNFKINQINKIGRKEKRVLKVVTDVLSNNLTKELIDLLIDEIITELNK